MESDSNTEEPVTAAHAPEPDNTLVSEMLTPSEIEQMK